MTTKRKESSQNIGKKNAKKIRDWVKTSPTIPLYQGRVNKARIFKMHSVAQSTLGTNEDLQILFAPDGPIEKLAREQAKLHVEIPTKESPEKPEHSSLSNSDLELKIKELEKQLNSIHLDLASESFLLATGRYIPKLYKGNGGK